MTYKLFPYQDALVSQIVGRETPTYLAAEMGTGKTPVAIAVAKKKNAKSLLIVCPAIGKLAWIKELARWWPEISVTVISKPTDVQQIKHGGAIIVPYSLLSMKNGYDYADGIRKVLDKYPVDMAVLDEAHALKNPGANRTKAVLKTILPGVKWALPMSGTPTPNHPGELFPIMRTVFPESVRKADGTLMKIYEFENAYCDVKTKWFSGRSVRVIEGGKNLPALRTKLAPFMIRKRKKDVLPDLPDMIFDTFPVTPTTLVHQPFGNLDKIDDDALLALLKGSGEHVMRLRRQIGEAKVPGAVEMIVEMLEGSDRKVLVFAHHQSVVDKLMEMLGQYGPVKVDGREPSAARQRSITRFLDDPKCRVFIGNIVAAGTSITLVGPNNNVSDVVFVEASFSPGDNVQAASRIHRIGQKDAVQVWFLTAYGTYDERIQDILTRKSRDFNELFGAGP